MTIKEYWQMVHTRALKVGFGILRGNLLWLVVCSCIWQFTTNIPRPYLPLYVEGLEGSPVDVGLVRSAALIAGLFLYPLGGYIADKQGRVRLINTCTIVYAFSFIPFVYATNWQTLAAASFLQSLVLFYSPILIVLQADSIPVGMRGQGFAFALSIPAALGVVSPFIGGYLVSAMGIVPAMRLIYNVGFGAALLVAVLRWLTLEETLDISKAEKIDYGNMPKVLKDSFLSFFETLRWMPSQIRALAVMQMIKIFFTGVAGSYWILYATDILLFPAITWGLTSAIQGAVSMISAVPSGRLMDRFGRKKLLIPVMSIVPFFPLIFVFFVKDFAGLAGLVVAMAISNAFLMPGFQSLLSDYTPREWRGRVTSAVGAGSFFIDIRGGGWGGGMLLFIPGAIAQILGGLLYVANPMMPFMMMSAGMFVVVMWAALMVKEPRKIEA